MPERILNGTVEKIISPAHPDDTEKAQIAVEGADHLYRELRIENKLKDNEGKEVALKPGAEVELTVEADPQDTVPKAAGKASGT